MWNAESTDPTTVRQQQHKATKPLPKRVWEFFSKSGVFAGCATALAIIGCGRAFWGTTTSTLFGWTALFFLALFVGVIVANLRSQSPFASALQMVGFLAGSATSLGALISEQYTQGVVSDVLLGMSSIILLPSLLGIRPSQTFHDDVQDRSIIGWSLRLDDLMKYNLPASLRTNLAGLIEALWQSPPDRPDFIPAQNDQFALLLDDLELAIRSGQMTSALEITQTLARCLDERNYLIGSPINVQYQNVSGNRLIHKK